MDKIRFKNYRCFNDPGDISLKPLTQIDKMSKQDMGALSGKIHDFLVYEMGIGINNYVEVINKY